MTENAPGRLGEAPPLAFVHETYFEIAWGDCDPAGIVFYPNYFRMFDACTAGLFRAVTGVDKYEMLRKYSAAGFPMVDTGARFIVPNRYGESIRVETSIGKIGTSSFEVSHSVYKGREISIEAFEKRVWAALDLQSGRLRGVPVPQEILSALARRNLASGENQ